MLAQSVFTHLPLDDIARCLVHTSQVQSAGSMFYATFFERSEEVADDQSIVHASGFRTFRDRDPFHARFLDLAALGLSARYIGEWGHPRGQRMVCFTLPRD